MKRIVETRDSVPQDSRLIVIDADRIPYLAALLTDEADLDPNNIDGAVVHILRKFHSQLNKHAGLSDIYAYCLSTKSFRHELDADYKSNRRKMWQPPLRSYCEESFSTIVPTWQYPGYEADDLVGILATAIPNCLIVSNDKDLNQIPGNHYDPQKNKLFTVTVDEARKQKYMQWIHGDSVDGIPGIPGIGPRKAEKFLDSLGFPDISEPEATDHVRAWYKECGKFEQPELYCELTRKMTWILTDVLGA
ncbi:5'-3' exonuclease-like [Acropora palmata]|uniref:5'-3' exonuclease-like n=1 Tax=Acropora palmata TaxID=6131 RepID=UPI003DA10F08